MLSPERKSIDLNFISLRLVILIFFHVIQYLSKGFLIIPGFYWERQIPLRIFPSGSPALDGAHQKFSPNTMANWDPFFEPPH